MALGLGIASALSAEAATAGLGLVMMTSVGPVLSVQLVGLVAGRKGAGARRRQRSGRGGEG